MVGQNVHIPGIQKPDNVEVGTVLRPITIYHEDGVSETAYVQTSTSTDKNKTTSLHSGLAIAYMSVGIVALTITAFAAIHRMKKS